MGVVSDMKFDTTLSLQYTPLLSISQANEMMMMQVDTGQPGMAVLPFIIIIVIYSPVISRLNFSSNTV